MPRPTSDVAFSNAVKQAQTERGSRALYARMEDSGGFEREVDDRLRSFLSVIDTAFLATASADGQPYVQHRGGPKGFIRALDEQTLAFIDYAGNRQYVSTGNLSENDRVCLFLIDYERRRRIKVWGTAKIVPLDHKSPHEAFLRRLAGVSREARAGLPPSRDRVGRELSAAHPAKARCG